MARKPMVTRTIITTKASAMCVNIVDGETETVTITLPRTYKDEKKLLKAVQNEVDSDVLKAVHIVATEEVQTMYGMTEQDFINNGIVLDPETRKAIEDSEEE